MSTTTTTTDNDDDIFPALPPTLSHLAALLPRTPLVRAALRHARAHSAAFAYNHAVRTWLFAALISRSHPALRREPVDQEVVALACVMHDLGWDPTGECVSADRRFEVDGADAAVRFLRERAPAGWDGGGGGGGGGGNGVLVGSDGGDAGGEDVRGYKGRKTQQVWDACALHTTPSIAFHKEPVVAVVAYGILADFQGPANTVPADTLLSWPDYDAIVAAYPRLGLLGELKEIMCGLCRTKPATTYDNTVGEWGELFAVEGYSREGRRIAEMLLAFTPALDERDEGGGGA